MRLLDYLFLPEGALVICVLRGIGAFYLSCQVCSSQSLPCYLSASVEDVVMSFLSVLSLAIIFPLIPPPHKLATGLPSLLTFSRTQLLIWFQRLIFLLLFFIFLCYCFSSICIIPFLLHTGNLTCSPFFSFLRGKLGLFFFSTGSWRYVWISRPCNIIILISFS